MSFLMPEVATPPPPTMPAAPAAPPMFGATPAQKKPKPASQQATVLGMDTQPLQGQLGQKTLLGA